MNFEQLKANYQQLQGILVQIDTDINTLTMHMQAGQLVPGYQSAQHMQGAILELQNKKLLCVNQMQELEMAGNQARQQQSMASGMYASNDIFATNQTSLNNNSFSTQPGVPNNDIFAQNNMWETPAQTNNPATNSSATKKKHPRANSNVVTEGGFSNNNTVASNSIFGDQSSNMDLNTVTPATATTTTLGSFSNESLLPLLAHPTIDIKCEFNGKTNDRVVYKTNEEPALPFEITKDPYDALRSRSEDDIVLLAGDETVILRTPIGDLDGIESFVNILEQHSPENIIKSKAVSIESLICPMFTNYFRVALLALNVWTIPTNIISDFKEVAKTMKEGKAVDYQAFKELVVNIEGFLKITEALGEIVDDKASVIGKNLVISRNLVYNFSTFDSSLEHSRAIQPMFKDDMFKITELSNSPVYKTLDNIFSEELEGTVTIVTKDLEYYTAFKGIDCFTVVRDTYM